MDREAARSAVRVAVQAELGHRGWNIAQLREATGIDSGTLSDFLNGVRWPRIKTLGTIEKALGWPAGSVASMLAGGPPPTVGGASEDEPDEDEDTLLYRRPEGLTDEEWEQVKRESRGFIEWQIQRAAQER